MKYTLNVMTKSSDKPEKRVCSFKGFGLDKPYICTCDEEELTWCRKNYEYIKREQYVDSKGQNSFVKSDKE